jgi:hypothetical protein
VPDWRGMGRIVQIISSLNQFFNSGGIQKSAPSFTDSSEKFV